MKDKPIVDLLEILKIMESEKVSVETRNLCDTCIQEALKAAIKLSKNLDKILGLAGIELDE